MLGEMGQSHGYNHTMAFVDVGKNVDNARWLFNPLYGMIAELCNWLMFMYICYGGCIEACDLGL